MPIKEIDDSTVEAEEEEEKKQVKRQEINDPGQNLGILCAYAKALAFDSSSAMTIKCECGLIR